MVEVHSLRRLLAPLLPLLLLPALPRRPAADTVRDAAQIPQRRGPPPAPTFHPDVYRFPDWTCRAVLPGEDGSRREVIVKKATEFGEAEVRSLQSPIPPQFAFLLFWLSVFSGRVQLGGRGAQRPP